MADDFIALDYPEKKRKYGGRDRDNRGSKRQKWNRKPEQSGANTTPLGERNFDVESAPAEYQFDDTPSSISRSNVNSRPERPAPDTSRWSEKRKQREAEKLKWRDREKELLQAVIAADKERTSKKAIGNKKLRINGNLAQDESRTSNEVRNGTIDKNDEHEDKDNREAPYSSHLPKDMGQADQALKSAKKEKRQRKKIDGNESVIKNAKGSKQPTVTEVLEKEPKEGEADAGDQTSAKKGRFICFVGQLPFTCTTADIEKHFSLVTPSSIRHMTHKEGGQSKGYAFLEFDSWDRMHTCLKLLHHSEFNDGRSKARKINIELTSGGGGNSENRKDRIASKNEKLGKERMKDYGNGQQEKNDANPNMTKVGSAAADGDEKETPMTKHERRMAKFAEDHRHTKTQRKKLEKQKKKETQKQNRERTLIENIKARKRAEAEAAKASGASKE